MGEIPGAIAKGAGPVSDIDQCEAGISQGATHAFSHDAGPDEIEDDEEEEGGEEAKDAAHVEVFESDVAGFGEFAEQDGGDQVAGENEEYIDSDGAIALKACMSEEDEED